MASLLLFFRAIMYSANDCGIYTVSEETENNSYLHDLKREDKKATPREYYLNGADEIFNNYGGRLEINGGLLL